MSDNTTPERSERPDRLIESAWFKLRAALDQGGSDE